MNNDYSGGGATQLRRFRLPRLNELAAVIRDSSPFERFLFWVLALAVVFSALGTLAHFNRALLVNIPASGGELSEGVIGSPRFVNPLLAISDADRDLAALVYSGLLRGTADGRLEPDLAERYEISDDGLVYTFTLRGDAAFHDGEPVTAEDVVFTVEKAKDPAVKSPKRANWEGVEVEATDERTVVFTLRRPYAPFLENMTLGILPKHIWEHATAEQFPFSQFNTEPIGSGPYQVEEITRNDSGIPQSYELESFERYTLGEPHIPTVNMRFYSSESALVEALRRGEIESANSITPERLDELEARGFNIEHVALPRIFGVFFNQNFAPVFAEREVRLALEAAVDREQLIEEVLSGYGTVATGPLPSGFLPETDATSTDKRVDTATSTEARLADARGYLTENGWARNEETGVFEYENEDGEPMRLSFTISTANTPELKAAAEFVAATWRELGAEVKLEFFEQTDLNQNVIRPRQYEALLFGEVIGRELDLFAFWHSSQRNDPGLNIALYANITADELLEEAREITDKEELADTLREFADEVHADVPAIFLYSPDFIYVIPERVKGIGLRPATTPSERFLNVHEWYVETDSVWEFFAR